LTSKPIFLSSVEPNPLRRRLTGKEQQEPKMKRIALIILLISLAAGAVMGRGQSTVDPLTAVTNQALTPAMLEEINLSDEQIEKIIGYQLEYHLVTEEINNDLDMVKAKIVQMLNKSEVDTAVMNGLLEEAAILSLALDKKQMNAYLHTRGVMGDECWSELTEQSRNRYRIRNEVNSPTDSESDSGNRSRPEAPENTGGGSSQSGSSQSGSPQPQGSSRP